MCKNIIRYIAGLLAAVMTVVTTAAYTYADGEAFTVNAASAVLMEASTGKVLYENNADTPLPPASVTKIMTLLIIYDSISSGKIKMTDTVTVSEHAASMGGSQIFLEAGETQSVETLTKSIAIASANDAAVAMAEYIGGSEEGFVALMNDKAKALGMKNTTFKNACGLDTDGHLMSARDIAVMSRELTVKYPDIKKYTTTWQDTITHTTKKGSSEFGLTNTNKLIKWYNGATGLKTGSTGKALYCLSGTATRDGMDLIAVVMAAPDPKVRFQEVMKLLDYGFANFKVVKGDAEGSQKGEVKVYKGEADSVKAVTKGVVSVVVPKDSGEVPEGKIELCEAVTAPVKKGDKLGRLVYSSNGKEIGSCDLVAAEDVNKAGFGCNIRKIAMEWMGWL
jgi:D-alanyl-D-alanine carboxypeptidase (penicillin-binding protein 5/6)